MSNDKKLLTIVSELDLGVPSDKEDSNKIITVRETVDDISDLVKSTGNRILSNTDYLILSGLSSGKGLPHLAESYEVSEAYIKKLMRSESGSEFLKEQAKQKADLALSLTTTTVYEGILKYQEMVDDLFRKGQNGLALSYLFGKQSLMEVQASLHKQQSGVAEDNDQTLINLFQSISVNNGK